MSWCNESDARDVLAAQINAFTEVTLPSGVGRVDVFSEDLRRVWEVKRMAHWRTAIVQVRGYAAELGSVLPCLALFAEKQACSVEAGWLAVRDTPLELWVLDRVRFVHVQNRDMAKRTWRSDPVELAALAAEIRLEMSARHKLLREGGLNANVAKRNALRRAANS